MSVEQRIRVSVVVLGDVGRSPRMRYHALALASALAEVDVVGYAGSALHPAVRDHAILTRAAPRYVHSAIGRLPRVAIAAVDFGPL